MNATDYALIIECLTAIVIAAIIGMVIVLIHHNDVRRPK